MKQKSCENCKAEIKWNDESPCLYCNRNPCKNTFFKEDCWEAKK